MNVSLKEDLVLSKKSYPIASLISNNEERYSLRHDENFEVDKVIRINVSEVISKYGYDKGSEILCQKLYYIVSDIYRVANIAKLREYKILNDTKSNKKTLLVIDSLDELFLYIHEDAIFSFLKVMVEFGRDYDFFIEFIIKSNTPLPPIAIDLLKKCQTIVSTSEISEEYYLSFFGDDQLLKTSLISKEENAGKQIFTFNRGSFLVRMED